MAKILAVDDSDTILGLIRLTLERRGHDVSITTDGRDALTQAKAKHFDLVLTDLRMPAMNGVEFIKELRGLGGYRQTPILALTAFTTDENRTEVKQAGATGWIRKPFVPATLLETIDGILSRC